MVTKFEEHVNHDGRALCVECACNTLDEYNRQSGEEGCTRIRGKDTDIYIVRDPELKAELRRLFKRAGIFDK